MEGSSSVFFDLDVSIYFKDGQALHSSCIGALTVPVCMPRCFPSSVPSLVGTLRNSLLVPVHSQHSELIKFLPISYDNRMWKVQEVHNKLSKTEKMIVKGNGDICYAYNNTAITWTPENDKITIDIYPYPIVALAETEKGQIIADNNGRLYLDTLHVHTHDDKKIQYIHFLSSKLFNIVSTDGSFIYEWRSPHLEWTGNPQHSFISVLEENIYIMKSSIPNNIILQHTSGTQTEMKILFPNLQVIAPGIILTYKNSSFEIIDTKDNKRFPFQSEPLGELEDFRTLHAKVAHTEYPSFILFFYSPKDLLIHCITIRDSEYATASFSPPSPPPPDPPLLLVLSDTTLIYCISNILYFLDQETCQKECTLDISGLEGKIISLRERVDGSIAVISERKIGIVRAMYKEYNPTNWQRYKELANSASSTEAKYNLYMAGFISAIRHSNFYKARRFYEKGKSISQKKGAADAVLSFYATSISNQLYIASTEAHRTARRGNVLKKRLFVGEGTFGYTLATLDKHKYSHPNLGEFITATAYQDLYSESATLSSLVDRGVSLLYGIDATRIHYYFRGKRFPRIHWNAPYGRLGSNQEAFKNIIPAFFMSASSLQIVGDRIHLMMHQELRCPNGEVSHVSRGIQKRNSLVTAATTAQYRLIRKRKFDYPGYVTMKTGTSQQVSYTMLQREFIFEKTNFPASPHVSLTTAQALVDITQKDFIIKIYPIESSNLRNAYYDCSSDEDSSEYDE